MQENVSIVGVEGLNPSHLGRFLKKEQEAELIKLITNHDTMLQDRKVTNNWYRYICIFVVLVLK